MKSLVEQRLFHELAFDKKTSKTVDEFRYVENVRSSNVVECEYELVAYLVQLVWFTELFYHSPGKSSFCAQVRSPNLTYRVGQN